MTGGRLVQVVDTAQHTVMATIPSGAAVRSPSRRMALALTWRPASFTSSTRRPTRSCGRSRPQPHPFRASGTTRTSVAISPDGTRAYVGVFVMGSGPFGFSARRQHRPRGHRLGIGCRHDRSWLGAGRACADAGWQPSVCRHSVDICRHRLRLGVLSGQSRRHRRHDHGCRRRAVIDLGRDGPNWTQQNTAAGIGVTPDRGAVYIAVPRLNKFAVADVNTNAVTRLLPVTIGAAISPSSPTPRSPWCLT